MFLYYVILYDIMVYTMLWYNVLLLICSQDERPRHPHALRPLGREDRRGRHQVCHRPSPRRRQGRRTRLLESTVTFFPLEADSIVSTDSPSRSLSLSLRMSPTSWRTQLVDARASLDATFTLARIYGPGSAAQQVLGHAGAFVLAV